MSTPVPGPPPGPRPTSGPPPAGPAAVAGERSDAVEWEVAAAMAALDGLDARPPAEHVAVYERLHAALGAAMAEDGPDGPGGPAGTGASGGR